MVDNLPINPNILQRLKSRADDEKLSIDELLEQWLDAPPQELTLSSSQSTGVPATDHKSIEAALGDSEARYRVLAENFPNGIVALYDHDLRYVVSHGEGTIVSASDLQGKRLRDVFPPDVYERDEPALLAALQGERRESTIEYQGQYFRVITVPVYDAEGNIINGMVMSQNISELKQAELEQKELNRKLELAIETAKLGIWELDIETGALTWNAQLHEIYGITPEEFSRSLAGGLRYVHPDDQDEADRKFAKIYLEGFVSDIKFRIIRPTGAVRHIQTSARAIYDSHNVIVKLLGASRDVTAQEHTKHDLIEKESHLRSLVETSTAYIIRTDIDGYYTYVNPIFFEHFGSHLYKDSDEIIGVSGLTHIAPEDHRKTFDTVRLCMENVGKPFQVIIRKPSANGETMLTFWEFVTIQDESGSVKEIQAIGIDITKQDQIEQALKQSQADFEKTLSSISDYVWSTEVEDGQLKYLYHSPAVEHITGYPESYFMSDAEAWRRIIHPDDHDMANKAMERELSGEIVKPEYRIIRADGEIRWIVGHTIPTVDDSGQVVRLDGVVSDITERKLMEEALRQSQANFEKTLSSISDYVWSASVHDNQLKYLYYSPVVEQITGYPPEYFMDGVEAWLRIIHPDDRSKIEDGVKQELLGNRVEHEYRIIRADGEIRWLWGTTTATLDDSGQVIRLDGVVGDITDRKLAENALRDSEIRYEALFEGSLNPIAIYDEAGRIVALNQVAALNMGVSVSDAVGHTVDELISYSNDVILERIQKVLSTGESSLYFEDNVSLHDGLHWFWSVVQPVLDENNEPKYVQIVSYDITERKRAEQAQNLTEQRYRAAIDASLDAFYLMESVYDADDNIIDFRIIEVNQNALAQVGMTYETLVGGLICELFPINRKPEFFDAYVRVVKTGEPIIREFFVPPEEQVSGWYIHQIVRVDNGIATITRDITEIKQQEQLQLENERIKAQFLKEQERNALTQRIISMLSHDLRTPLTIVATSQEMLSRYYDRLSDESRQEKLQIINRQIQFAINLLQDTVDMIRGGISDQALQIKAFNLASLCRISVEEFATVYGHSHHLEFVNLGNVQMVDANETLISRILLNLLSNAIKYTPEGGEIRLELDKKDVWITLKLIDNGMGISAEDLPHLFEPFFRTDSVTEISGTGLGLSIVQDCVDQHQGRVYVESELGQGTTFIVELPS